MYIHDGVDHRTRAQMLVRQLVDEHDAAYGVGSMTCSVYDTAWVAMVTKSVHGRTRWLFPTAFGYLLKTQQHDGGWHATASDIDGILNTLAALLALCKHIAGPEQLLRSTKEDLQHRQARAVYYLEAKLSQWDVSATIADGFEILVPKLLQLLAVEGIEFYFAGRDLLDGAKATMSAKYDSSLLYSSTRSSIARFLEGFVGEIDFDRVSQHKISGSIMASPASTAVYLMHSSTWDADAEGYLNHILSIRDERSTGGVPSQYPTTVFEVTQALSVLLDSGFSREELGLSYLENAADFLEACLSIDAGVTGSAPYVESDADSTARSISTLCKLGRIPDPQGLIFRFESRDCFKTYTQECDPCFRTNCLVLKALLALLPGSREQDTQIEKTLRYIVDCWWTTNGYIEDHSNTSQNYPTMLMVDALVQLIDLWEEGSAPILDDLLLRDKTFICVYQALTRALHDQNVNGSWGSGNNCESTAYGLLVLSKMANISSAPRVKTQLVQAVEKARRYLADNFRPLSEPEHVWQGKNTMGSNILFQVHVLAALQVPLSKATKQKSIESRCEISLARIAVQTNYCARQSYFARVPKWQVEACLVESQLFLPQLREVRYDIFPQSHLQEDQYFETIPFTWLAASNFDRRFVGSDFLCHMMIISFLNRQLDNYLTHWVEEAFAGCIFEVEDSVQDVFDELECTSIKDEPCLQRRESRSSTATSATAFINETHSVFQRFISYALHHSYVLTASSHDQAQLRSELRNFLLGRISQIPEQRKGSPAEHPELDNDAIPDQTHHAYMLAFFSCLVGNQSMASGVRSHRDFLDTPEQQYLAAAMCRHLSTVSFVSNTVSDQSLSKLQQTSSSVKLPPPSTDSDTQYSVSISSSSSLSSAYSDGEVSPLSAISSNSTAPSTSPSVEQSLKPRGQSILQMKSRSLQLTRLLSHERRCLDVCLLSLDAAGINQRTANVLGLFVDVSELSELLFRDPNIGSCYHPTTAIEVIEQACILQPAPAPPIKAKGHGSVANARAALAIEPLKPKRDSSRESSNSSHHNSRNPSPPSMQSTGTPPVHCEFNFNQPVPAHCTRRTSRSSIEMSRIEHIMSTMGESTQPPSKPPSREALPSPKINPVVHGPHHPHSPSPPSTSDSSTLPPRSKTSAQKPQKSPTPVPDAEAVKLAKARLQTQKQLYDTAAARLEAERRAEVKAQRRRASGAVRAGSMREVPRKGEVGAVKGVKSQGALRRQESRVLEVEMGGVGEESTACAGEGEGCCVWSWGWG